MRVKLKGLFMKLSSDVSVALVSVLCATLGCSSRSGPPAQTRDDAAADIRPPSMDAPSVEGSRGDGREISETASAIRDAETQDSPASFTNRWSRCVNSWPKVAPLIQSPSKNPPELLGTYELPGIISQSGNALKFGDNVVVGDSSVLLFDSNFNVKASRGVSGGHGFGTVGLTESSFLTTAAGVWAVTVDGASFTDQWGINFRSSDLGGNEYLSTSSPIVSPKGRAYLTNSAGAYFGIDSKSGAILFERPVDRTAHFFPKFTLGVGDGLVLTYERANYQRKESHVLDAETGDFIGSFRTFDGAAIEVTAASDKMFFGTVHRGAGGTSIAAVDDCGKVLWESEIDGAGARAVLSTADGRTVVESTRSNHLRGLALLSRMGKTLATLYRDADVLPLAVGLNGAIYAVECLIQTGKAVPRLLELSLDDLSARHGVNLGIPADRNIYACPNLNVALNADGSILFLSNGPGRVQISKVITSSAGPARGGWPLLRGDQFGRRWVN